MEAWHSTGGNKGTLLGNIVSTELYYYLDFILTWYIVIFILKVTKGWTEVNNGGKGNYGNSGTERMLHEQSQKQIILDEMKRKDNELEREILKDPERRHLGGGQHCGFGPYVFEWAINGKIVSWDYDQFCEQYTRLAYNLDVIKFMDDESQTGDFELAMRIKFTGTRSKEEMCITHLYWA